MYPEVMKYLPIQKEIDYLPKQFILNVSYKIIGDQFGEFIKSRVTERNDKVAEKGDLNLHMDPEIYEAY